MSSSAATRCSPFVEAVASGLERREPFAGPELERGIEPSQRDMTAVAAGGQGIGVMERPDGAAGEPEGHRRDVLDGECRIADPPCDRRYLDDVLAGQPRQRIEIVDPEPGEDPAGTPGRVE